MAGLVKKFLASASVVGMSAVFGAPAMAASLSSATMTGPGVIWEQVGQNNFDGTEYKSGSVDALNALRSSGNVELSGQLGNNPNAVSIEKFTTLEVGFDDGSDVTFRSFTRDDWEMYGSIWFNEAWNNKESGFQEYVNQEFKSEESKKKLKEKGISIKEDQKINQSLAFLGFGFIAGYERLSDPNVASVSKDDENNIFLTLAGHNNHSSKVNFSELIIAEVNGKEHFLYKIGGPDRLGAFDDDAEGSFEGLYDFEIKAIAADVPEPSTVLGLMAIGGLVAATKRKSQK